MKKTIAIQRTSLPLSLLSSARAGPWSIPLPYCCSLELRFSPRGRGQLFFLEFEFAVVSENFDTVAGLEFADQELRREGIEK